MLPDARLILNVHQLLFQRVLLKNLQSFVRSSLGWVNLVDGLPLLCNFLLLVRDKTVDFLMNSPLRGGGVVLPIREYLGVIVAHYLQSLALEREMRHPWYYLLYLIVVETLLPLRYF